jgi:hypothetical protein
MYLAQTAADSFSTGKPKASPRHWPIKHPAKRSCRAGLIVESTRAYRERNFAHHRGAHTTQPGSGRPGLLLRAPSRRKDPCSPCAARPPTTHELESRGYFARRDQGLFWSDRRGSVADTTLALRARHATWPERRRPCPWRLAAAHARVTAPPAVPPARHGGPRPARRTPRTASGRRPRPPGGGPRHGVPSSRLRSRFKTADLADQPLGFPRVLPRPGGFETASTDRCAKNVELL